MIDLYLYIYIYIYLPVVRSTVQPAVRREVGQAEGGRASHRLPGIDLTILNNFIVERQFT